MATTPLNRVENAYRYYTNPDAYVVSQRRYHRFQQGYKSDQRIPLTYKGFKGWATGSVQYNAWNGPWYYPDNADANRLNWFVNNGWPAAMQPIINRCFARLQEKVVGDRSEFGVFFAEFEQSLGLIASRGTQLFRAARSLRRLDFDGFLKNLRIKKPLRKHTKKRWREADDLSSLWLEYWFGWAPLCSDIFGAGKVIEQDLPGGSYRAEASDTYEYTIADPWDVWKHSYELTVRMGARFKMVNPNLFLLERVGLLNPLSIAWELVPFSFVVDWFFDVGAFVDSTSAFAGIEITNSWTNLFGTGGATHTSPYPGMSGQCVLHGAGLTRQTGLSYPLPNFQVEANLGQSITRAASAVSLLTQELVGLRGVKPK